MRAVQSFRTLLAVAGVAFDMIHPAAAHADTGHANFLVGSMRALPSRQAEGRGGGSGDKL